MIRNHNGEFVASCSRTVDGITDPEIAEAIAIRDTVQIAEDNNFLKVIVSSDCLLPINKLNDKKMDRSSTGLIVKDIKKSLLLHFVFLLSMSSVFVMRQRMSLLDQRSSSMDQPGCIIV